MIDKETALQVHDPPWITITAFNSGNNFLFKYYRIFLSITASESYARRNPTLQS